MFGFLKKVLGKPRGVLPQAEGSSPPEASPRTASETSEPYAAVDPNPALVRSNGHQNGSGIELPLKAVVSGLPAEFQARVKGSEVKDLTITVSLEKVLSQLPLGCVKISFGELRQSAFQAFSPESDRDRDLVSLPLGEILAQVNPALIKRRRVQRQVEVPPEISSPFDSKGRGLSISTGTVKPEARPAAPKPEPLPPGPMRVPLPQRKAPAPEPAPTPVPVVPLRGTTTSAPKPVPPAAPPIPAPTLTPPNRPLQLSPQRPVQTPSAAPAAKPAADINPLVVTLAEIAEAWPEPVRREIVQLNLLDAKVSIPWEAAERGMRQGRLSFTWRMLRSWMRPAPAAAASPHDTISLDVPLKIVAPQFLARRRSSSENKPKVEVDEGIPNLFFGFPQGEPAAAQVGAGAKPADTNYYVWDDTSDTVRVTEPEVRHDPGPGTRFVAKYATPNEIVSRAASLDGVAGALVALPDGLLVASRLPTDLNADTVAAFLPQIFGKVSQCTKELRMGDLNNLNFTVGNVPWKIFRVNAIFFAAFGRVAEPLPTAQLAALAAELDHKRSN